MTYLIRTENCAGLMIRKKQKTNFIIAYSSETIKRSLFVFYLPFVFLRKEIYRMLSWCNYKTSKEDINFLKKFTQKSRNTLLKLSDEV